jgi:hypothetical protein
MDHKCSAVQDVSILNENLVFFMEEYVLFLYGITASTREIEVYEGSSSGEQQLKTSDLKKGTPPDLSTTDGE